MAEITRPDTRVLKGRRKVQLAHIIAGDSITEASKAAGYASIQSGSRALADTRSRLRATMDHFGLTEEALIRDYLMPLMNATETKLFAHEGIIRDQQELADNGTRKDTLRMAFQLRGSFPKEDSASGLAVSININNMGNVE